MNEMVLNGGIIIIRSKSKKQQQNDDANNKKKELIKDVYLCFDTIKFFFGGTFLK